MCSIVTDLNIEEMRFKSSFKDYAFLQILQNFDGVCFVMLGPLEHLPTWNSH